MSVLSTTPEAETGGLQVTSRSSHHSQWLGVFSSTSHGLDQWFVYTRSSNLYLCQWKPSACMYSLVPKGKLLTLFWGHTSCNMLRPAVICYSTKGLGSHTSQGCIVEFQKLVGKRHVPIVTMCAVWQCIRNFVVYNIVFYSLVSVSQKFRHCFTGSSIGLKSRWLYPGLPFPVGIQWRRIYFPTHVFVDNFQSLSVMVWMRMGPIYSCIWILGP